uniref:Uncharacterized protein n=1 Tax=Mola mola TaxID=94237 RepID=A0A3Q3XG96_MOLML
MKLILYSSALLLLLIFVPRACEGGNILVFPTEGSHWINMDILLQALHSRGHNITIVLKRSLDQKYITELVSKAILFERGALPLTNFLHMTLGMFSTFVDAHMA